MKKIAFLITSTGWGGLEMNTIKLAQQFIKLNYHVLFITRENTKLYEEGKIIFDSIKTIKDSKKYFDLKNAYNVSKILKQENIDTVLIICNRDIDLLSLTKRFFYKKLKIIYQQQMQVGVNKKDLIHTIRYKSLQYWISPLPYLKKEVTEKTKFPQERIKVIPLGIDLNKFLTHKYLKEEALQKLNIINKASLIGIIGRIDRKKGQDFLIRAVSELRKRNTNVELLIFGSPTINDSDAQPYFAELKKLVAAQKLEGVIHFRDYTKEVELFYDAIDIFALASYSEAFGMVTIEAMASKLPIIASNTGGSPEILGNGKFGLLYDYDNINSFCEKVEWILQNKQKANEMVESAKTEVIKNYSEITMAKQISDLISL